MKKVPLWIIAAFLVSVEASTEKKIVCYFNNTSVYRPGKGQFNIENIDSALCTHLVYSYARLTVDGEVKTLDPYADLTNVGGKDGYNQFNKLRLSNSRIKTFIAVGGWNESSSTYSAVAADQTKRKAFVENAVRFVKDYGFDGMSFDWQYPNQRGGVPADKKNYVKLLKMLREGFDQAGLLLMATVAAIHHSAEKSYDIPEMVKYLDTINLMTFDFHGPWESQTGFSAPLFSISDDVGENKLLSVNDTIHYWLSNGAPAHKLVLGIPAFARTWTLKDPENNEIGAPVKGPGKPGPYTQQPGFRGFNEIVGHLNDYYRVYDVRRLALYAYNDDDGDWFSYEDDWIKTVPPKSHTSIRPKGKLIKDLGLGGAMLYHIDTDDFLGFGGNKYTLLKGINRELREYQPPTPMRSSDKAIDPCDLVCRKPGYLRDPSDCAKYYYCQANGASFLKRQFRCPAPLVFDLTLQLCNWQSDVNCQGCKL